LNFLFASLLLCIISEYSTKAFSGIRKALESSWLVRLGKVSYGMYLFHWAILVYVVNRFIPAENIVWKIVLFIPYVFLVYIIAEASFRLYESKFLKLKDSLFIKHKTKKEDTSIPAVNDASINLKTIPNE
jgi:peptidoglycan/LPS O-acetylase OafA/YrhL